MNDTPKSRQPVLVVAAVALGLCSLACAGGPGVETVGGEPGDSTAPTLDATVPAYGLCLGDGKCGLVDREGRWVVGPLYNAMPERPGPVSTARIFGDNIGGIVDRTGTAVSLVNPGAEAYDEASLGLVPIWPEGRKKPGHLVDGAGEPVGSVALTSAGADIVRPRWAGARKSLFGPTERVFEFSDGLAPACDADGCGYLAPSGDWAFRLDKGKPAAFSDGRAVLSDARVIDATGATVIADTDCITPFVEGHGWCELDLRAEGDDTVADLWIVDRDGNRVKGFGQDAANPTPFHDGVAAFDHAPSGGLALVTTTGEVHPAPAGTAVLSAPFEGRALYAPDAKGPFGWVDPNGAVAIEAVYAPPRNVRDLDAMQFSEGKVGAALASDPTKWGYLDASGAWAIAPRFDRVGPFQDGLAKVVEGGAEAWIDDKGAAIAVRP